MKFDEDGHFLLGSLSRVELKQRSMVEFFFPKEFHLSLFAMSRNHMNRSRYKEQLNVFIAHFMIVKAGGEENKKRIQERKK